MKNLNLKKVIASFAFITILSVPIAAYASSYSSSLYFDTTLTGATRSFNGSNITMSIKAYTTGYNANSSSYFSASLYRKNTFSSSYIGNANYLRNGTSSNTWTNVGSGNYYFYFSKGTDGNFVNANSGDVSMYN